MDVLNTAARVRPVKRRQASLKIKRYMPCLYLVPFFTVAILFLFSPFCTAIIKSLYRYDMVSVNEFVGFQNYINLFTADPKFAVSMRNLCFVLAGLVVCFQFPIIAAKLTISLRSNRTQYLFRSCFMLPMGIPGIVTTLMWKFIYYPEVGVLSKICDLFGVQAPNLLGSPQTAMLACILIGFPWVAGMNYILVYSALQGIDQDILEASTLDGVGYFARFFKIELPLISPQLFVLGLLAVIAAVQDYEKYLILTGGGPLNSTLVPGLHMYNMAFGSGEANFGYSCAIAVTLFLITLLFAILLLRVQRKGEE